MKTLHDGQKLLLKEDRDGTLIVDARQELTPAQVKKLDRLMSPADENCWFGEVSKRAEVLALVRQIDMPWTSRAEEERAAQQRVGGR